MDKHDPLTVADAEGVEGVVTRDDGTYWLGSVPVVILRADNSATPDVLKAARRIERNHGASQDRLDELADDAAYTRRWQRLNRGRVTVRGEVLAAPSDQA